MVLLRVSFFLMSFLSFALCVLRLALALALGAAEMGIILIEWTVYVFLSTVVQFN